MKLTDENESMCALLTKGNLFENLKKRIDLGASQYVCVVKEPFATYTPIGSEEDLFMGNTAIIQIEVSEKIIFKMTSYKVVALNNVLHVPIIRKNLVSTVLLVKKEFKYVFISEKVKINKNEMYVGITCLNEVFPNSI